MCTRKSVYMSYCECVCFIWVCMSICCICLLIVKDHERNHSDYICPIEGTVWVVTVHEP